MHACQARTSEFGVIKWERRSKSTLKTPDKETSDLFWHRPIIWAGNGRTANISPLMITQINCSLHESTGLERAPDCKTLTWLQHRNSAVVQSHGQMKPTKDNPPPRFYHCRPLTLRNIKLHADKPQIFTSRNPHILVRKNPTIHNKTAPGESVRLTVCFPILNLQRKRVKGLKNWGFFVHTPHDLLLYRFIEKTKFKSRFVRCF